MTVGQLRRALAVLPEDGEVQVEVWSAPFDDEEVELIDVRSEGDGLVITVDIIDDFARELQEEDARLARRGEDPTRAPNADVPAAEKVAPPRVTTKRERMTRRRS